jgi:hypothetical protein
MAISGAAVSPNMGYHSSPPLAFLLTVFNIRLGWWLGNPKPGETPADEKSSPLLPAWKKAGPRFGLFSLLAELFGVTSDRSQYIYLSDGGHFDNLGLYELVRRRCRYIISCDAGQDEKLSCDDLGNAIRKCYADLGIEIEIDVKGIRTQGEQHRSQWHCAVGTIHYEKVDQDATPGTLIYLKASLTGDEPTDLLSYNAREPLFPHQSTADQWFDESQFESYRKLGYHIAKTTFEASVSAVLEKQRRSGAHSQGAAGEPKIGGKRASSQDAETSIPDEEALFQALRQYWYPPSIAVQTAFTRHGKALEEIYERLRKDENLKFLDAQIYPEWDKLTQDTKDRPQTQLWLPATADEMRAGFYLCNSMIQLMENVYLDLQLEQEYDHPDNRGWMNLFKHWSWSGMFRATWAVSACTSGARFQSFCKHQLDLTLGEAEVCPLKSRGADQVSSTVALANETKETLKLNFLEAELIRDFCNANRALNNKLAIWVMEIAVLDPTKGPREAAQDDSSKLTFTFGFALVDEDNQIVYFRVRDHLRKMGLARKGLKKMQQRSMESGKILGIALQKMPANAREVPTEMDSKRFQKLFMSVRYELQGREG